MAEAYLKSLHLSQYSVMSSGVLADRFKKRTLSRYAADVLRHHKILHYAKSRSTVLTQSRLDRGDITIFMNREVYRQCIDQGMTPPHRSYIWDIPDIFRPHISEQEYCNELLPIAERMFHKIQQHILELLAFLKRPRHNEKIDILDGEGRRTGRTSDVTTILSEGLIYPGVHIAFYTPSGRVVLEQRSSSIVFNPGLWDLTMGGIVSAGESPDDAAVRETKEELGIDLRSPKKLFVWEYHHYLPHYGFHSHGFVHTYIAKVPDDTDFTLQTEEVADAGIFDLKKVQTLNASHRRSNEQLIPMHAYFDRLLHAIEAQL